MKVTLLISLLLLASGYGFSQQGNQNVSIDSIAVWELRKISHPLSLSSEQKKHVLGSIKRNLYDLNNIKQSMLTDSNRVIAIREARKSHKKRLKIILSKNQFDKYKDIEQSNKAAFISKQNQRRIKVVSLDEN